MILHGYYRSSASFRVRIALNMKGLNYQSIPWHLRHGEQESDAFAKVSHARLIPVLDDGGLKLTQSLAIVEYLDEMYRDPPFLPKLPADRAHVRALAQSIACDIHPIDNLRVLKYLRANFAADEAGISRWYNHWIATGFDALETLLSVDGRTGKFCFGDMPGFADIMLIPQVVNGANYALDMSAYPTISRIFEACMALPPFEAAHPRNQADAE